MIATRPGHARGPRFLRCQRVLAVVVIALVAALVGPAPDAARAAQPGDAAVTITAASVEGAGADAVVVVSGEVTNTSGEPLPDARANLWWSTARLRSSAALESAIAAEEAPTGHSVPVAAENTAALVELGGALEPGATSPFSVRGRLADLGMTATDTSYWVGAVVHAGGAAPAEEAGAGRTLVTVPAPGATALVVPVVELSARPRLVKQGLFTDDGLAEELAGRLGVLLEAAARPDTSWIVDPALLAEVRDMADGYAVLGADGPVPGARADAAAAWLAELERLAVGRGHASLFAQPDLAAATALDAGGVLEQAKRAGADADAPDVPPLVTLATPDAATLAAVAPLGAPVLATGLTPAAAWVTAEGADVVAAGRPGGALASPTLADTPLNRTAVLEARARAAGAQARLLRSEDDVEADAASRPAWTERRPLAELLATEPVPWVEPDAGPRAMDAEVAARIAELPAGLTAYAAAAPESGVDEIADEQTVRGTSLWWLEDPGQLAWLDAVERTVGYPALAEGITLGTSPRFSMSGTSSDFPVTVTNRLVDAIVVTVVATTDNPQRISFEPAPPVTVAPGASETVLLRAVAEGSGVVTGQIHVEAPGQLRLTADVPVIVETTNFGLIGWVLVLSSGVVLVVSTAARLRQVRRRQQEGTVDG